MRMCTDPILIIVPQYGTQTFEYLVMNDLISVNEWFLNNCDLRTMYRRDVSS